MLIEFKIENWKSFRDPASLSLAATREKQHPNHMSSLEQYGCSVLPVSVLFGGNASGKTNFFSGMEFAQTLINEGRKPKESMHLDKFALDDVSSSQPVKFLFKILADDIDMSGKAQQSTAGEGGAPALESIYEYSFSLTEEKVVEEKLVKINTSSQVDIFARNAEGGYSGRVFESPALCNLDGSPIDPQRVMFISEGTRDNQLFLTSAILQNLTLLDPVGNWFSYNLTLIHPSARYMGLSRYFDQDDTLLSDMEELISQFGTGIDRLDTEQSEINDAAGEIESLLDEGKPRPLMMPGGMISKNEGKITHKQLFACHHKIGGGEVRFNLSKESDGTKRLFDILPALIELLKPDSKAVFVIDELDRSLHCALTRGLIEYFLVRRAKNSRSQLLLTTHDISLFSQEIFRRDEIWLAERRRRGDTTVFSLCEYKKERKDKDIQKSYLRGHFGGIPTVPIFLQDRDGRDNESLGRTD